MLKKIVSVFLILIMAISLVTTYTVTNGAAVDTAPTSVDYGLGENCEDGNILHCFNWTLAQIKAELPNIAAAGFTSVQTSPLQAHNGSNQWYWLYQPNGFSAIGNELGSYSDLQALCTEADKYGVKIIVDVVANHVAGSNNGTWASSVESTLKQSKYFHNEGAASGSDYDDRYKVTHKNIGMPDLKSEHTDIQNMVYNMIVRLKNAGVDGIRWDAAKHIGLPSEDCNFWSKMAEVDIYQYGEILNAPAGDSALSVNTPLMQEYAQYIAVNDDRYSSAVTKAVNSGSIYKTSGYWNRRDVPSSKLVYWAESHDTYANDGDMGWTKNYDQNTVDKAYALLASRKDVPALYLSRPSSNSYSNIYIGRKGSTHFTSPEVAAVNRFHNAMGDADEKYNTSYDCYVVWRSKGAVIVTKTGSDIDVTVANSGSMVPVGTYVDEVSGSTFTVTSDKITGHIGSTGIAVIYNKTGEDPTDPPHTHTPAAAVKENNVAAGCVTAGGYDEVTYCSSCGEEISRVHKTVNALGHALTHIDAVPVLGVQNGTAEHYKCTRCQKLFSDSAGKNETTQSALVINARYLIGDSNGNDDVDISDATIVQRYLADIVTPFVEAEILRGDANRSGALEITDVTVIQRYLADIPITHPVGTYNI